MRVVGLDPGVHTGFAQWRVDTRKFEAIQTLQLHQVLFKLAADPPTLVMFEDARRHRVFGGRNASKGAAVLQGVGSVKRDCGLLAEFLDDLAIPYSATPPLRGGTKWSAEEFERVTRWTERTSNHARDAAVRIFQLTEPPVVAMIRQWQQSRDLAAGAARRRR